MKLIKIGTKRFRCLAKILVSMKFPKSIMFFLMFIDVWIQNSFVRSLSLSKRKSKSLKFDILIGFIKVCKENI